MTLRRVRLEDAEAVAALASEHWPEPVDADLVRRGWTSPRRPWRRRGLGRALLLHAFAEFRRRGVSRAGLGVEAESLTGANRLYESVGMHVAHRFDSFERAL